MGNAPRIKLTDTVLKEIDFTKPILGKAVDSAKRNRTADPDAEQDEKPRLDWIVMDTVISKFGIRVFPGRDGAKALVSFFVRRKMGRGSELGKRLPSASRRRVLGHYPLMSLADARIQAEEWLGMMAKGIDPTRQKQQDLQATADANAEQKAVFSAAYFTMCKEVVVAESTMTDRDKVVKWMENSPLWKAPMATITQGVVIASIHPLFQSALGREKPPKWGPKKPGLATAWKIFRYCAAAYAYYIAIKYQGQLQRGESPFALAAKAKNWPKVEGRRTVLKSQHSEGKAWLAGLVQLREHDDPAVRVMADYLICNLIWGGRKREGQLLTWDRIDWEGRCAWFCKTHTKTKRNHYFPLSPWVLEILESRRQQNAEWGRQDFWVFVSRTHHRPLMDVRRALKLLQQSTGVWITPQDLRRTAAGDTTRLSGDGMLTALTLSHAGGNLGNTKGYVSAAQADVLRPIFQQRETLIREQAGLVTSGVPGAEGSAVAELLARLQRGGADAHTLEQEARALLAKLTQGSPNAQA